MSTSNQQRRAAKRRRRSRERSRGGDSSRSPFAPGPEGDLWDSERDDLGERFLDDFLGDRHRFREDVDAARPPTPRERADAEISTALSILLGRPARIGVVAPRLARSVFDRLAGVVDPEVLSAAVASQLRGLRRTVAAGSWTAGDLEELVRRRVGELHVDAVADQIAPAARFATPDALAGALHVAVLLALLPLTPTADHRPQAGPAGVSTADAKRLATVRGLLAKAERTTFDDEAETYSAKAQELITKHALERLMRLQPGTSGASTVTMRRIWLDSPYLVAKASLIEQVARANRCRSVMSETLGVCSVVGDADSLAAVELLATSLLVQANRSMLRHGRQVDRGGTSRTRSFRQAFLLSFAYRIGQRLQEVDSETVRASGRSESLLPVLRHQSEQVDDAVATMFPHLVRTGTTVTNADGWVAGHAAADLAQLDLHAPITETG